ncbi:hypothetical protein EV641_109179 [Rhodococcus sp. SMB37]|uniref:DUF2510 domain-containing protein n=1 Tax=Rhodococcus sp. SMB37 TaxID=2512213 RepID=UPI0010DFDD39|nr:DUF2510 domain-containing protein [Rhodococcus sp. SMB37]TCN51788.1 hypothetical protein EV641_109179 [Rhodococcus sp. SMB37]
MTNPQPESGKKKRWPLVLGGVVAVFVGLIVLGLIVGPQEEEEPAPAAAATTEATTTQVERTTTAPTSTSTSTAAPTTTTATTTTTTEAPPPPATTTAVAAPVARFTDPRCAPADPGMIEWIKAGLTDSTLILDNTAVIDDGGLLFIGASTVRPDGKFENRSDVWIVQDSMPFSSTGGARSTTSWPKASDVLGISPGDERVQAVDSCVVELSRG